MHQLLLMLPVPPLVVDVVDRRRSWRQVCFVVVVVVVVVIVLILIVGVLVADQCRGDANTSSSTETHSGTALETDRVDETSSSPPVLSQSSNLSRSLIRSLLLTTALILAFSNTPEIKRNCVRQDQMNKYAESKYGSNSVGVYLPWEVL